jgi:hypothetical protein
MANRDAKNHYDGECLKWIPEVQKQYILEFFHKFLVSALESVHAQKNVAVTASGEK